MANLISLDTYKQAKALTSTKEDDRLNYLITAVSQLIKTYCNTALIDYVSTAYTEYISIDGTSITVQLTESPVIEIEEVWVRPSPIEEYTRLLSTEFVLNKRTDSLTRVGGKWPTGVESVMIVYTAGYVTVPVDLALAVVDLVSYYFKEEYKAVKSMGGASIQNSTTSTLTGNTDFPDHIKRVLDLYRQIT